MDGNWEELVRDTVPAAFTAVPENPRDFAFTEAPIVTPEEALPAVSTDWSLMVYKLLLVRSVKVAVVPVVVLVPEGVPVYVIST
jgi:hypothetical protein